MLMQDAAATPLSHFITRNGKADGEVLEKSGVRLISLDVDLSTLSALGQDDLKRLRESFKLLEDESDLILAVASSDFIPHLKTLLHAVDEAIVITPHPIAEMINAYGLIKLIVQVRKNIRVGIVASSVTDVKQAGMIFEKMKRIVKKFLDKTLYDYGFISDISGEVHALNECSLSTGEPYSKAITCVSDISRTLIESPKGDLCSSQSDTGPRGFAERLFISTRGEYQ
jgi:MinD-like ATPase involved in chromosome partitioning or flagellar assembly